MFVNQIAVFLENKQGRLNSLLQALSAAGINMDSLNIADTNDFGVVRMITSDNAAALEAIKAAGFTASSVDLVAVEVKNCPGQLAAVLDTLDENNVSIEYLYSYTAREGATLVLFKTAEAEKAQKLIEKHKI